MKEKARARSTGLPVSDNGRYDLEIRFEEQSMFAKSPG
jgi:hypothetical protein